MAANGGWVIGGGMWAFGSLVLSFMRWSVYFLCVGNGASHHSRVTVVSYRNTAVRIGHAKLSSCMANRKIQGK